jgi:hypothetical protein
MFSKTHSFLRWGSISPTIAAFLAAFVPLKTESATHPTAGPTSNAVVTADSVFPNSCSTTA